MITFKYLGAGAGGRQRKETGPDPRRKSSGLKTPSWRPIRLSSGRAEYPPGSPEDLQQRADEEAAKRALAKYAPGPDLDAMVKKYPWLQAPQPKSGPQLQMPKPSFGYKPPALLGDEYKLKLPGEQKKEDEPALQRKAAGEATTDTAPPVVHDVLQSAGQPLDAGTRAFMEQRFGHDFGQVRVHTDARAAQSAQAVSANAYTVGHNIVFGVGRFAPETHEGRRLIAHELTHVVQQSSINGSRVRESDRRRGLPSLSTTSEVHVQRGPSDPESPKVDVPILGASKATSEIVVLYHYGDLEAMGERDAKTEMGSPFTSSRSYPRLTDCDTATCQAEVARHTGTPPRETVRHKYELRIDRAYFEKNFSNTGTRGAYSEFASKQSIPIKYFRRVSTIAPASSAPPRLPNKSGEFTAKTPRPTPPTQRGKAVTQSGSYQEVLSGEMVKGEIGGKGVPPTPTGSSGAPATAKVNAATGAPLEPVVEATPGF